ncbi:MAG: tRNA guanosine(15) transglycosylase TgtA [Candidatus Bathyarchaeota archaeon]|jgi:7-cyano-7-deazaguanine tRNA-ribosyltransferase
MSFEIRDRDLLARVGRIRTKSGVFETPALLPVVNPSVQPIPPKKIKELFGCKALITNAYIIKKNFAGKAVHKSLHKLLDFDGVLMTDSGAYQILVYGNVEVSPEEIVSYQEEINTDIATILDVPTGWEVSKEHVQCTVKETLKRAEKLQKIKTRNDIVWVGPVQGGSFLDLVAKSAKSMGKLPFEIHALGSPTPVMEQYLFDTLVDMILTAKMNLPPDRPLHLFGAGHPFMFALAVALGCDLFDSAAYAIFAREDRYMTEHGTTRLNKLTYLPCSCPICTKYDTKNLRETPKNKRQKLLAQHNLYVCFSEMRRIKQAIIEGRLWEYLEMKARSHPALFQAFKRLKSYENYLERTSPVTKKSGLFFFNSAGLARPEIVRHRRKLLTSYQPPKEATTLVLLPQTKAKPFHMSSAQQKLWRAIRLEMGPRSNRIHMCTYAAPFGVVPTEIDEVYPLSQYETTVPFDTETMDYVAEQLGNYIIKTDYARVILVESSDLWKGKIAAKCKKACRERGLPLTTLQMKQPWNKKAVGKILKTIQEAVM